MSVTNANLIDKMECGLHPGAGAVLETLVRVADEARQPIYLVGGPVRDLLLDTPTLDLDLTVEGDAPTLASRGATITGDRIVRHPAFRTATLRGKGYSLDLAMARTETYRHPGALPRVRPASVREDLRRRDFTINAMALGLGAKERGELLDPCGGRADLEAGLLRALHETSFADDATRILRAARYETRLGFRLEERTLSWLRRDIGYLDSIGGARLRQEISRIFHEATPERALLRLQELGALAQIHPSLAFDKRQASAFRTLRELIPEAIPAACWPLLFWDLDAPAAANLAARLQLGRAQARAVAAIPELQAMQASLARPGLKPSAVDEQLSLQPPAVVQALAAATGSAEARQRSLDYLGKGRYVQPFLSGANLLKMGVPQGPAVREMLRQLKVAKLDGEVASRKEEEQLVLSLLASGTARRSK